MVWAPDITSGRVHGVDNAWQVSALGRQTATYLPVYGPKGLIGMLQFADEDFKGDTVWRILGTLLQEIDEEYCAHA